MLLFLLLTPLNPATVDLRDLSHFPQTLEFAQQNWLFGSQHLSYLRRVEPWEFAWINDAEYCMQAWSILDDIKRCHKDSPQMILHDLNRLKEHLGADAYAKGEMPPAAPFHRFREIR